ncbi:chromosomal replication initiator protein DnaA, partial [Aquicoccus sp. SCR17]|nr:chromosomal replication initiator protein DnaA [Carideicomes alvinocaridis]
MTNEEWAALQDGLRDTVGSSNYVNWIEPLEFHGVTDGVATFLVPTNFIGNYVSQHFGDLLLYKLTASGADVRRVHFQVATNGQARPGAAARAEAAAAARGGEPV